MDVDMLEGNDLVLWIIIYYDMVLYSWYYDS